MMTKIQEYLEEQYFEEEKEQTAGLRLSTDKVTSATTHRLEPSTLFDIEYGKSSTARHGVEESIRVPR